MDADVRKDALWIRDIDDELMQSLEESARLNDRTVEEEVLALRKLALTHIDQIDH